MDFFKDLFGSKDKPKAIDEATMSSIQQVVAKNVDIKIAEIKEAMEGEIAETKAATSKFQTEIDGLKAALKNLESI